MGERGPLPAAEIGRPAGAAQLYADRGDDGAGTEGRMMTARFLVSGQRVAKVKVERSRTLRRAMTPAEERLWQGLRRKQLAGARFRRQQVIDGFIADFYCPSAGLVIEVDGAVHGEQQGYDAERDSILVARNLRVLRFTNDDVLMRLDEVLNRIHRALIERTTSVETE